MTRKSDAVTTTAPVPCKSADSARGAARHRSPEPGRSDAAAAILQWPPWSRHAPLAFLLLLALALRVPGVTRPLLGNFATKSAVYGMIARNLAEGRASILHPTLDVLRGGRRSLHLTEMPVSAYLTGGLWKLFGGSLDVWGRATSIGWSLIAVAGLYWLLRDWHGELAARGGAAALALSPVAVIYGQSFQLEASLVAVTVLTVWCADRWLTQRRVRWLAAAVVSAVLLLLTKIYMAYLILPLVYLAWRRRGASVFCSAAAWCAIATAAAPALAWYGYAYVAAAGGFGLDPERVYYSVRDSAGAHPFPHPLLWGAEFYRHLLDDLTGVALTPIGFVLALLAVCRGIDRRYVVWLAGCGLLILLLPRKFYEMNYYWSAVLVPLCALVGLGYAAAAEKLSPRRRGLFLLGAVWLVLSLRLSLGPAFSTPPQDAAVVEAGRAVQHISRPGERVVTLHGSSLDLLYYCDRPGWVLASKGRGSTASRLAGYRADGAAYFVVAGRSQLNAIPGLRGAVKGLPLEAEGRDFVVYRLSHSRR
jgi:hypothetical protein